MTATAILSTVWRRSSAAATGPSGTHCRAPRFQRHLAGAEHGVLEPGESFGGGAEASFWQLGAIAAIPAGQSVVRGGTIPYRPEALAKRNENRAKWPAADPEAKCYMLGVPRVTYHNMPFQIFQGDGDLLMVYPFAAANRVIYMTDRSELPVDSWMGKSDGTWDGDVLVVTTKWQNGQSWLDRAGNHASNQLTVTERFTLLGPNHIWYEATLDDPLTYTRPWTIEMPLYRLIDQQAQLLEHKCVTFADGLLYQDLLQKQTARSESHDNRVSPAGRDCGLQMLRRLRRPA